MRTVIGISIFVFSFSSLFAFEVDTSKQPATHPPLAPREGEEVELNPPPMIWRADDRAESYILEMSLDPGFAREVIQVDGIGLPFYNHSEVLAEGEWHWRYQVVTADGEVSEPGPVRSFRVPADAVPFPVKATDDLLAAMPDHPRIFTTPDELDNFRARRHGLAREAWREVKRRADAHIDARPDEPVLAAPGEAGPTGATPGSNSWKEGQPTRRQVFFLRDGEGLFATEFKLDHLKSYAGKANVLSFAYLISGDIRYAEVAKDWALFVARARVDYHLNERQRASHDTVVYAYEGGLKNMALTFDRIYDHLSEEERTAILEHIEYHGAAAYRYLRERAKIHLAYQQSHPQQAMHALLTTALAVATDSRAAAEWTDYLVRQYANRIAWTSEDGGYFEGQTYGHKFRWILEGLVAMRTATGIDSFQRPSIRRSGDFWLYCMSLNYWYEHGGDIYSLILPYGNAADGYISNLMASMNEDRYVQWWSDTVFTNPVHIPFYYLSQTDLKPKPPVDIPQAKLFPETGQLSAFDRFYDHGSERIFFRSSRWGGHSHSHADQNNFVIHANGEIMAADAGYYTYYGDDYHMKWSVTTQSHNSILVNGEGQPKSIESKGEIIHFFDSPAYTFFIGDASDAYEEPLERFKRAILFIRPDVWVVYDELAANEASEFAWLLNTFDEPVFDEARRTMVVPQSETRMSVDHLLPESLTYTKSNERPYPIQTRAWARFTEAVPEPWHTRVTTPPVEDERILTLLHTYQEGDGTRVEDRKPIENAGAVGLVMNVSDGEEVTLFRRVLDREGTIRGGGLVTDGVAASLFRTEAGGPRRWMVNGGSTLGLASGEALFRSDEDLNIFFDSETPAAAVQVVIQGNGGGALELALHERPKKVFLAPPHAPEKGRLADWEWADGVLRVSGFQLNEAVLWVDPVVDPREPLPEIELTIHDSDGSYRHALELAVAPNGEWVAFAELMPREPGVYRADSSLKETAFLIQDRFDPSLSVRGSGAATGTVRDATEIFARCPPGSRPTMHLRMRDSFRGGIVNYLRNGGFEHGIPGYPPRGWTMSRKSGDPAPGWIYWSQEDSFEGESAMKFVRPDGVFTANSQPMRLRTGGPHLFRFMARGNATHAKASISAPGGTAGSVRIEPSDEWREYRIEADIEPGYTQLHIRFNSGGQEDQVVWIDDMEFGPIEP